MKIFTIALLLLSLQAFAEKDREGDLNLPVSDISTIQKQEEELPPTLDEVEMNDGSKTEVKTGSRARKAPLFFKRAPKTKPNN